MILFGFLSENIWQPWSLFIRLILNQGSDEVTYLRWNFKFKNSLNKFSFVLLIIIWSQSASILTKAFTGNLLNTYFRTNFQPIVETLEDIYQNNKIEIASGTKFLIDSLKRENKSVNLISHLYSRANNFIKKYNYTDSSVEECEYLREKFVTKMIQGEAVFLVSSMKREFFQNYFSEHNLNYQVSSNKYGPNQSNFIIFKTHPLAKLFKLL